MREIRLASWKLWTIAGAVVASTVLVTTLVVGNWGTAPPAPSGPPAKGAKTLKPQGASSASAPAAKPEVRRPSHAEVQACNQVADKVGQEEKTKDVLTKAVVGGLIGAGVGAAGGAIADGGKGAGKGAAIGGIVGTTAGTLYGLNDPHRKNARAKEAYRACMRERGYAG